MSTAFDYDTALTLEWRASSMMIAPVRLRWARLNQHPLLKRDLDKAKQELAQCRDYANQPDQ